MTEPEVQPDEPRKLPVRVLVAAGVAAGVVLALGVLAYYLITNRPWEDSVSDGLADRVAATPTQGPASVKADGIPSALTEPTVST